MTYLNLKSNKFSGARSVEDYFNDFLQPNVSVFKEGRNFPTVNVKETKENYSLEFSAPGRKKEDFNILVQFPPEAKKNPTLKIYQVVKQAELHTDAQKFLVKTYNEFLLG